MKQILILIISVILFSCSDNEIRYHIEEVTIPNDTLTYLKSDMSLLNGVVYSEFGELGKFSNGEREGRHKRWYENGQLEYDVNYKGGKFNGLLKSWFDNGQLRKEGKYINGKGEGLWKIYNTNGQLINSENYRNGEKNEIHKGWYKNGQLQFECYFKNGKKDGLYKQWYENGQLQFDKNYINDTINGMSIHFNDDGQILSKGKWENGKMVGIHNSYFLGDKIKSEVDYDINIMKFWNTKGDLFYEGEFDNDKYWDLYIDVDLYNIRKK